MSREGQDGINSDAASMDHTIPVVAYYIDGPHAWTASEIGLFTTNVHVKIASRFTTPAGNVIDCESGDTTPAEAAQWAAWRRADGYLNPMVYVSVDNQQAVIQAFLAAGQALPEWWLAHWDDLDQLPSGALGKQYASAPNLDRSIWADYIPGVDLGTPALPSGKIPPGTILHLGSRGAFVSLLQATLNREYPLYSHLAVDGIYEIGRAHV